MDIQRATTTDIDQIIELGNSVNEFKVSDDVVSFWPRSIIENIFVSSKFRGKSIGDNLLDQLVKDLKNLGCKYLCTLVKVNSDKAIALYMRNHFNRGIDCAWLDVALDGSFKGE